MRYNFSHFGTCKRFCCFVLCSTLRAVRLLRFAFRRAFCQWNFAYLLLGQCPNVYFISLSRYHCFICFLIPAVPVIPLVMSFNLLFVQWFICSLFPSVQNSGISLFSTDACLPWAGSHYPAVVEFFPHFLSSVSFSFSYLTFPCPHSLPFFFRKPSDLSSCIFPSPTSFLTCVSSPFASSSSKSSFLWLLLHIICLFFHCLLVMPSCCKEAPLSPFTTASLYFHQYSLCAFLFFFLHLPVYLSPSIKNL